MTQLENRLPPPLLWLIASAITWLVARADIDGSPLQSTASEWLGVLFAVVGIGVAFAGLREFSKANTTSDPHNIDKASALVTTGVYRFTRNPMYVGLSLLSIGWGLRLGTAVGLAVGTGLLIVALIFLQIRPEERALSETFGSEYAEYRSSVRRWI